jgi:hypothetical protein
LVDAVGHDEDSLSLVRRAAFSRAEYSPRHFVTQLFQVADDAGESQRDVSFDILKKAELWSKKSNAACDVGPKMSRIFCSSSLSGAGEWLTRVAAREDVHQPRKLCPRKGLEIAPDRSRIKLPAFHSRK